MAKKFITSWFYSPIAKYSEHQVSGFWFWKTVKKVVSDQPRLADYDHFAESLESVYNNFDKEGYDVINIVPLSIGTSEQNHAVLSNGDKNYLGDTGFSVTRGAIVVGKRRES